MLNRKLLGLRHSWLQNVLHELCKGLENHGQQTPTSGIYLRNVLQVKSRKFKPPAQVADMQNTAVKRSYANRKPIPPEQAWDLYTVSVITVIYFFSQ